MTRKQPPKPVPQPKENVVNLAEILRKSLALEGGRAKNTGKSSASKRKSA